MPMMLDRIAGNAPLKQSLKTMLQNRHLTHSILLVGEPGTGKGFAARCLAADWLYPQGGPLAEAVVRGEGCLALADKAGDRDSGYIQTGKVRDIVFLKGAGAQGGYWVGQVTALRRELQSTSLCGTGRIGVFYNAENMNERSANALLKTIEEPPENVLFILTASSLAAVLPTIRSRCVTLSLSPLSVEECAAAAVARKIKKEEALKFSAIYDGNLGLVLDAAQNAARRARLDTAQDFCRQIANKDPYELMIRLVPYEKNKDKAETQEILKTLCALAMAGLRQPGLTPLQPQQVPGVVAACTATMEAIAANGNRKIVLTRLAVQLAG